MIDPDELLAPVSTIQLLAAIRYWATDLPYSAWPNSPVHYTSTAQHFVATTNWFDLLFFKHKLKISQNE
jgi:hypothetical protein